MDRERTADDLRDYAAARRLLAVWQALFVGLLVQLATGINQGYIVHHIYRYGNTSHIHPVLYSHRELKSVLGSNREY